MRENIKNALKTAMVNKEAHKISTLRLILAAIKDRDIASRGTEKDGQITDEDIMQLLQSMIKQRKDSIAAYEKGGRKDLVDNEQEEINIIQEFLPKQMDDAETEAVVKETIKAIGATSLKDMGAIMAKLREQYAGRLDFGKASGIVKKALLG